VLFFHIYISTANIKTVMCGYDGWPRCGCGWGVGRGVGTERDIFFVKRPPPLRVLRLRA